jgi:hypothetical protein
MKRKGRRVKINLFLLKFNPHTPIEFQKSQNEVILLLPIF